MRVRPGAYHIVDSRNDGAIQIVGDNSVVDFQGAEIFGCDDSARPNTFAGRGIVVKGHNVIVKNVSVRGYKVGIFAADCDDLWIESVDLSGNYRQKLKSTPEVEATEDWLYPHENDNDQWVKEHGAGIYIADSDNVTVRRVRLRRGQNGIMLVRVNFSRIYENDCSFLSGWGLSMWRCNRNVIANNAFDFCVRGYSHGVYNRGQDSAGILAFEQNNNNLFTGNSATHCGDGFFGFGGSASLAGSGRTGNNGNYLLGNDFSYAAAHGIEITFSFDNLFSQNRIVGNAICGIWAGYSQDTTIVGNNVEDNGDAGYGVERGGINIEHGRGNSMAWNRFANNTCAIHLWSDKDAHLEKHPWIREHDKGSIENRILGNVFDGDRIALQLRQAKDTSMLFNRMISVQQEVLSDDESHVRTQGNVREPPPQDALQFPAMSDAPPIGSRKQLRGRQHIMVTEWGPYDYSEFLVSPRRVSGGASAVIQVLGPEGSFNVTNVRGAVRAVPMHGDVPANVMVSADKTGLQSFEAAIETGGRRFDVVGSLLSVEWRVRFYQWRPEEDPREHADRWQELIDGPPLDELRVSALDFHWGGRGPTERVPADRFGTVATASVDLPGGEYAVRTVSDDGIRVWIDGDVVIDDWTWHAPTEHDAVVTLKSGSHDFRVEHFEIDGHARLKFQLQPIP